MFVWYRLKIDRNMVQWNALQEKRRCRVKSGRILVKNSRCIVGFESVQEAGPCCCLQAGLANTFHLNKVTLLNKYPLNHPQKAIFHTITTALTEAINQITAHH